jgi:hypothetical protein
VLADVLIGTLGVYSIGGFIADFLRAYIPYKFVRTRSFSNIKSIGELYFLGVIVQPFVCTFYLIWWHDLMYRTFGLLKFITLIWGIAAPISLLVNLNVNAVLTPILGVISFIFCKKFKPNLKESIDSTKITEETGKGWGELAERAATELHEEFTVKEFPTTAALPPEPSPQAPVSTEARPEQLSGAAVPPSSEAVGVGAQLQAPRGTIPIASFPQTFGREDFRKFLPSYLLNLIESRHFAIHYDYAQRMFYIQDLGSRNGTYVNGVDIRGKGLVPLKNGDLVVPANVIPLKFITNIN